MLYQLTKKIVIILICIVASNMQTVAQDVNPYKIGTKGLTLPNGRFYNADTLGWVNNEAALSQYGGCLEVNVGGTGFFHVKEIDSVWYVVDPEGYIFITVGVTSVQPGGDYVLPQQMKDWGINTLGCWSNESIENYPFCPRNAFLRNFKNVNSYLKELYNANILPVFDTGFVSFVDSSAASFVEPYKTNPWVFGYHTDNELALHYTNINDFLALDTADANYKAAYTWMIERHGSALEISDTDVNDFKAYVAETYMATVNSALKKYDPNHMNIGCRIHSGVKYNKGLIRAIGRHVDINSINLYNKWKPEWEVMDMWLEEGGKPFLISEFYTKAQDSGLDNENGAGWEVYNQQDRVAHFENFVLSLLAHRGSVGWTWFRHTDRSGANKGILTADFMPYNELIESMTNVSKDVYNLRTYLLNSEPNVDVSDVFVSPNSLDLTVGDTSVLNAFVIPANASNKSVSWSSNDANVVSVNDTGLLIARTEGVAKIKVTTEDGRKTSYCLVNVTKLATAIHIADEHTIIQLYPVPVKNYVKADLANTSNFNSYEIYSMDGRLVHKGFVDRKNLTIDVSMLSKGSYTISFIGHWGRATQHFIKI